MYLNEICFDLITSKSNTLADVLLSFAIKQNHHYNDNMKSVFIVNGALSKYLQNKKEEAGQILNTKDWSSSSDDFKLANEILTDNFDNAYSIMHKIGNNGDVDKSDYKVWPLFNIIREENKFKETYKEIFGEEYSIMETPMRPLQGLINDEIKKNKELKKITVKKVDSAKEIKEKQKLTIEEKQEKVP